MRTEYLIGIVLVVLLTAGVSVLFLSPPIQENAQEVPVVEDMADVTIAANIETQSVRKPAKAKPKGDPYKEIVNPSGFVSTDPITIKQFVGKKIILVDFLTYSCINCQRTFPYLNAWNEKYRDQGLLIVGIHTPEFAFEKNIDNVRDAMKKFGITHPIVLDNDYSTWNAWGNRYWPRKYLIDIHGNVVYDHIGEGAYETTEKKIRELLDERAKALGETVSKDTGSLAAESVSQAASSARSPETYFGSVRNEYFGNGSPGVAGIQKFSVPQGIKSNTLYLGGMWDITSEHAKNIEAGAKIMYKFEAKNVHFVAGSAGPVQISVFLDGKNTGTQTVQTNTLYTLVSDATLGEHTLEIVINSPGLEAYTFTFN